MGSDQGRRQAGPRSPFKVGDKMEEKKHNIKDHAIDLARRGWAVFPLKHRSKIPATGNGFKAASSDPVEVERMFGDKDLNVGIATGPASGFWVLDLDGEDGIEALARLEEQHGKLPTTVSVKTGAGEHRYFATNGVEINNRAKIDGMSIDVRGDGGYAVAARSQHPDGHWYEYINDPDSTPIATATDWLVDLVVGKPKDEGLSFVVGGGLDLADDPGASKGSRHHTALRLIGSALGRGEDLVEVARLAVDWGRRCSPPMPDEDVLRIVGDLGRKEARSPQTKTTATPKTILRPHLPWRPFPVEVLPEPVRSFVRRSSEAIGCDPAYITTAILPTIAGAVGTSRQIILKRGWVEPSVLWGAIVGDSGTLKSPAIDAATSHVRKRQAQAVEAHRERVDQYDHDLADYKIHYDEWRRSGRKKSEPPPQEPEKPVCERFACSDITVEGLAVLLSEAPRGLTLIRDELSGWIGSFDQYKAGRSGADTAHWLTIHGARDLIVDRKTGDRKSTFVRRASVSIVGGIQARTLRRALGQEHFENGLAARLLLAMPPQRAKKWTEATVDQDLDDQVDRLFDRLYDLQPDEDGDPITIGLDPGGKDEWVRFYNEHAQRLADASGEQAAVLSKIEGAAARIALLDHLIRGEDGAVGEASVRAGVEIALWFADEAASEVERDGRQAE